MHLHVEAALAERRFFLRSRRLLLLAAGATPAIFFAVPSQSVILSIPEHLVVAQPLVETAKVPHAWRSESPVLEGPVERLLIMFHPAELFFGRLVDVLWHHDSIGCNESTRGIPDPSRNTCKLTRRGKHKDPGGFP